MILTNIVISVLGAVACLAGWHIPITEKGTHMPRYKLIVAVAVLLFIFACAIDIFFHFLSKL